MGIILICVALASLGMSATVSIIYFTLCSRKPRRAIVHANATAAGAATEGAMNSSGGRTHAGGSSQTGRASSSSSSQHGHNPRQADPSNGSQLSIGSLPRQRRQSPGHAPNSRGARKKVQKSKGTHRMRQPRYHNGLSPHIEEPETAKSQVNLKPHHSSSSNMPSTSSGQGHGHGHQSSAHFVDETQLDRAPNLLQIVPPSIVIDDSTLQSQSYDYSINDSLAISLDTTAASASFANNADDTLDMTGDSSLLDEASTDDVPSTSGAMHSSNPHGHANSGRQSHSNTHTHSHSHTENHKYSNFHQAPVNGHSESDSSTYFGTDGSVQSKQPPTDFSDQTPPSYPSADSERALQAHFAQSNSHFVEEALSNRESEQSSLNSFADSKNSRSSDVLDSTISSQNANNGVSPPAQLQTSANGDSRLVEQSLNDATLPPSSRHHKMYADQRHGNGHDLDSESRSSFNSAFSNEGGDPDEEDLKRVRSKMKELIQ